MNWNWFSWFLGAIASYAAQGIIKWMALLLPLAIFTYLFGTVGYVVGFAACFAVIICDIQAASGEAGWVQAYETSLWGYLFAGTVMTMMAGSVSLSLPVFLAVLASSYGVTWLSFRAAELCDRKAGSYTDQFTSRLASGV